MQNSLAERKSWVQEETGWALARDCPRCDHVFHSYAYHEGQWRGCLVGDSGAKNEDTCRLNKSGCFVGAMPPFHGLPERGHSCGFPQTKRGGDSPCPLILTANPLWFGSVMKSWAIRSTSGWRKRFASHRRRPHNRWVSRECSLACHGGQTVQQGCCCLSSSLSYESCSFQWHEAKEKRWSYFLDVEPKSHRHTCEKRKGFCRKPICLTYALFSVVHVFEEMRLYSTAIKVIEVSARLTGMHVSV